MITAEPDRQLALFGPWGKNARIRSFLGLKFMAKMIRLATDPATPTDRQVVDLTPDFQFGDLFMALSDCQVSVPSANWVDA